MKLLQFALALACLLGSPVPATASSAHYVVHISVDGLRADAVAILGPKRAPNFFRLRNEGAYTDNARTDADFTNTLPNHTSMLTGRGVDGADGHNYTSNGMPSRRTTLHRVKDSYVSSVFDVVHDNGLTTALFAGKPKFILYEQSYNVAHGAPDLTGDDDGRDKIDTFVIDEDSGLLVAMYMGAMMYAPFNYTLLHLRDPDTAGHGEDWDLAQDSEYLAAVSRVDGLLGIIIDGIENDPKLNDNTTIILTADHGGRLGTTGHGPPEDPENFTIPFYVWGAGVTAHTELYVLNGLTRADPGAGQMSYAAPVQPIRNGDGANLALALLGLHPVPGSTINVRQDLRISADAASAVK